MGHAILMAMILIGIGVGVYRVIERNIFDSLDATLLTSAKTIRDGGFSEDQRRLRLRNAPYWWSILDEFYEGQRLAIRSYAQMVDLSGNISAKTGNIPVRLPVTPNALSRAEKGLETYETFPSARSAKPQARQVTLPVFSRGRFTGELIQVGAPLDPSLMILKKVRIILFVSLTLALVMSIIFGHYLTRMAFKPVERITRTAAGLGVNDLDQRMALTPADDELRSLISTFNGMLDRLEDAFLRLRRFAGDVSHELRTPLAVLRGEAELALRRDRSLPEYKEALSVISAESKNMTNTVEDLLLLARAQGNALDLKWQDIGVEEFLEAVSSELLHSFRAKEVDLLVEINVSQKIRISKSYLSLAVKNLLLNALKHSKTGGKVELSARASASLDAVEITVRDYGAGIRQEDLPYIFDAFYRADTARNRKLGGAGIGLSLSQAMVRLHKGSVKVESEEGKGAAFTLSIPNTISSVAAKRAKGPALQPLREPAPRPV